MAPSPLLLPRHTHARTHAHLRTPHSRHLLVDLRQPPVQCWPSIRLWQPAHGAPQCCTTTPPAAAGRGEHPPRRLACSSTTQHRPHARPRAGGSSSRSSSSCRSSRRQRPLSTRARPAATCSATPSTACSDAPRWVASFALPEWGPGVWGRLRSRAVSSTVVTLQRILTDSPPHPLHTSTDELDARPRALPDLQGPGQLHVPHVQGG